LLCGTRARRLGADGDSDNGQVKAASVGRPLSLIQINGLPLSPARAGTMRTDNLWLVISLAWFAVVLGVAVYVIVIVI
jgi:hypothetical protein